MTQRRSCCSLEEHKHAELLKVGLLHNETTPMIIIAVMITLFHFIETKITL